MLKNPIGVINHIFPSSLESTPKCEDFRGGVVALTELVRLAGERDYCIGVNS